MSENSVHPEFIWLRGLNQQLAVVTLPPELLGEIFLECIDRGAVNDADPQKSIDTLRKTRLSLASVCYRWRQVAQAIQMLWAVTSFSGPLTMVEGDQGSSSYTMPPTAYDLLHHELQLSGTAPISLVSQGTLEHLTQPPLTSRPGHELAAMLAPMLSRCHKVFLDIPGTVSLSVLNHSPEQLANIESLTVQGSAPSSSDPETTILDLDLSRAHLIRHLSICLLNPRMADIWPSTIRPRLADPSRLRSLTLSGSVDCLVAYEIISRATSLRSLVWTSEHHYLESTVPSNQIPMRSLEHLILSAIPPVLILPHLDAPKLLSLTLWPGTPAWDQRPKPFPNPSQALHLRCLVLDSTSALSPMVPPVFPEFRALEVLELRCEMSVKLAVACAKAPKLRLVVLIWIPLFPSTWDGPLKLLESWSGSVESGEIMPLSRGVCFVYSQVPLDTEQLAFRDHFVMKFPSIKIGLRQSFLFSASEPDDWNNLFARFDRDPSYLPPFSSSNA